MLTLIGAESGHICGPALHAVRARVTHCTGTSPFLLLARTVPEPEAPVSGGLCQGVRRPRRDGFPPWRQRVETELT